jgi:CTD small phosphatase-like protein 2
VRPFSRNCLVEANKYFEVAIFTAGNEWFADKIIDFLDPDNSLIQHRYFRQHTCQLSDDDPDMYVKDLSIFKGEVTIDDILIVDNNIYSFAFNLENGIPILNYLGDKKDDQLLKIIKYLNLLKGSGNLRIENERVQELKKMYDGCNWLNFIHYYDPDELSDDLEEPDFDNDGITIK